MTADFAPTPLVRPRNFIGFFLLLRELRLPVTLAEFLTLLEVLAHNPAKGWGIAEFYALARAALVKREKHFDLFDQAFAHYFGGVHLLRDEFFTAELPTEWLRAELRKQLSPEEIAQLEALGGPDALRERFEELLREQRKRHAGGNRWIGTGGTSPFGNSGVNPAGYRVGGENSGNGMRRALKVWEQRRYRNLRDDVELNTRNLKRALSRLRVLDRDGSPDELDIDGSIAATARNAGLLDLQFRPEERNRVKVLLLLDVGGSMDDHIALSERLFSAAKHQFQRLTTQYFHNCLYESVWPDNRRRFHDRLPTLELLQRHRPDTKVIFVGDAAMSPWEIVAPGGSVEHHNPEPGTAWLQRILDHFPAVVWLNPVPEKHWRYVESTRLIHRQFGHRMFPLTVGGIDRAMRCLRNPTQAQPAIDADPPR